MAPTPADLAVGAAEAEACLLLGLVAALVCYAAALPVFARSRAPETAS